MRFQNVHLDPVQNKTMIHAPISTSTGQFYISEKLNDPKWDRFLEEKIQRHHVQSSLWAQLKHILGWNCLRIVVHENEEIIGGAQILFKQMPYIGVIGYISQGPIICSHDTRLAEQILQEVSRLINSYRIQYLIIQPPFEGEFLTQCLQNSGFMSTSIAVSPQASVWIDLQQDLDEIYTQLSASTRRNIRRSQKRDVVVREGNEADLCTFYKLLQTTGSRSGFSIQPQKYFTETWRILSPSNHIKLFIAEYQNNAISASMILPFGDTVSSKFVAWNGKHGDVRPNEAIHWAIIQWAKSNGYRYYDLESIDLQAAKSYLEGKPLPKSMIASVTRFKMGFGGKIVVTPQAYDRISRQIIRLPYRLVYPIIEKTDLFRKIVHRFRISPS